MASIRSAPRGPFKASRGKPTAKDRATIVILKIINIPKSGSVRKLQTPERVWVSKTSDIYKQS